MAAGYPPADVLSRVRREQRSRGSGSSVSGLRIVLTATAITIAILLFAFGALGMLMMARAPQEPIASRLDQPPALPLIEHVQQDEVPNIPPAEKKQVATEPKEDEPRAVKTMRFVAPAPAPEAQKKEETAQREQPVREPETTASVPPPQQQQKQRQVQRQQTVRRENPESQSDNPLFRLFGIKQYR